MMMLEYEKIGFGGHCDELVATIDDQTVKVGELSPNMIPEWRRFFHDKTEFVKPLDQCERMVSDGPEEVVFSSQTGSKLILHCNRCKLDRGNIVELETGQMGVVKQRVGLTVTVVHRNFWSQQLVGQRRSCLHRLPWRRTMGDGCRIGWFCCSTRPASQLACVKRSDLQDVEHSSKQKNNDLCSFFTPAGVRSSGSGVVEEQLFHSSVSCQPNYEAPFDNFDIGHWSLEKKSWKVKSMLLVEPSPQEDETVDLCSWVAGATSRTKNLEAGGDCKCPKWGAKVHCGEWVSEERKFFLKDLQSADHACAKADSTDRKCR